MRQFIDDDLKPLVSAITQLLHLFRKLLIIFVVIVFLAILIGFIVEVLLIN